MSKYRLRLESVTMSGKTESSDWPLEQEKLHLLSELIFEKMKGKLKTVYSVSDMKRMLVSGYKEMSKNLIISKSGFNFENFLTFVEGHMHQIIRAIEFKDAERAGTLTPEQIISAVDEVLKGEEKKGGFRVQHSEDVS